MTELRLQFSTDIEAATALKDAGFSLGIKQRSEPRGVMFGNYAIAKWRNLSSSDIRTLHGVFQRHGPSGARTTVTLRANCAPSEVLTALAMDANDAPEEAGL